MKLMMRGAESASERRSGHELAGESRESKRATCRPNRAPDHFATTITRPLTGGSPRRPPPRMSREEVRDLALGASESFDESLKLPAESRVAAIEAQGLDPGNEVVEGGVNGLPGAVLPSVP